MPPAEGIFGRRCDAGLSGRYAAAEPRTQPLEPIRD